MLGAVGGSAPSMGGGEGVVGGVSSGVWVKWQGTAEHESTCISTGNTTASVCVGNSMYYGDCVHVIMHRGQQGASPLRKTWSYAAVVRSSMQAPGYYIYTFLNTHGNIQLKTRQPLKPAPQESVELYCNRNCFGCLWLYLAAPVITKGVDFF